MPKKKTNEEYIKEVKDKFNGNIVILEPYINSHTKILHKCLKHNFEYYAMPYVVLKSCGCIYCGKETIGRNKRLDINDIKNRLFKLYGNEYELLDDTYINNSTNMTFLHRLNDGSTHTFISTINRMLKKEGSGCGVCHGLQVCVGYNDIATTNPYVASLFANHDETHVYTEYSNQFVDFKCPNCGYLINKKISYVTRYNELSCPICGDGYSYPNKFIYNCLLQVENIFDFLQREYHPKWCTFLHKGQRKTGKYDIYFSLNGKSYICEMDGGIGHGNREMGMTKEDALFIDGEKDRLAKEHNVNIIRIDCNYTGSDRYDFIKNNIINSALSNVIDFSKIDFLKANTEAQSSLLIKACKFWNQGYTSGEIATLINVSNSTVSNYLKLGSKYGICNDYSLDKSRCRSHGKSIICLNTGKIFNSIVDGANYYNITESVISKCCRKCLTYGGVINGEKLIWMYLDEYNKFPKNKIDQYIPKVNNLYTKVVCLNNNILFDSVTKASKWSHAKSTSGITNCCTGKYRSSGKHPITQEPLRWMYYDDYIKKYDKSTLLIFNEKSA